MNELVSEFFYEAIRRIIPGLALIISCFRDQAQSCFHHHREFFASPIFFAICLIALAWPLGVLIETITYFIPVIINDFYLIKRFPNLCLTKFIATGSTRPLPPKKIVKETPLERDIRRQEYLHTVTKDMCRCLAGVCLLKCLFSLLSWCCSEFYGACPHLGGCCVISPFLGALPDLQDWWIYFLFALAFLFPWLGEHYEGHFRKKRQAYLLVQTEKD
jgi:hypothetical protein